MAPSTGGAHYAVQQGHQAPRSGASSVQQGQQSNGSQNPQIHHILSLPPTFLTQLARADDTGEQQKLASSHGSQAQAALSHMAQTPPPPAASPGNAFVPDVLPYLLHTKFSPHTLGIAAVAGLSDSQRVSFEPTYASVDLWAEEQAKILASNTQVNSNDLQQVAEQLKAWAHNREEREVTDTINQTRANAVERAAQAAMQRKQSHDLMRQNSLPQLPPEAYNSVDLESYKRYYSQELERRAHKYYPALHQRALSELASAEHLDQKAKLVRASAVAALAANVLAANDMASAADRSLKELTAVTSAHYAQSAGLPAQLSNYYANDLGSVTGAFRAAPMVDPQLFNMAVLAEQRGQCSPGERDILLHFAHGAYSTGMPMDLLPLLHLLDRLHPHHCPTLLLLSCVYYSRGSRRSHELKAAGHVNMESDPLIVHNFDASLMMNYKILDIDPEYVEAMSNIGTTMRALNQSDAAESWWRRAIAARPTYFDAIENLLGVLVLPTPGGQGHGRVEEAIKLCSNVETHIFGSMVSTRPIALPSSFPANHVHRLQNMLFAKGNLHAAVKQDVRALRDYERAVEILLSSSGPAAYPQQHQHQASSNAVGMRTLIQAVTVAGLYLAAQENPESPHTQHFRARLASLGWAPEQPGSASLLDLVAAHYDAVQQLVASIWSTPWPSVLIKPEAISHIRLLVFGQQRNGNFPALSNSVLLHTTQEDSQQMRSSASTQTAQTTSTILLTIAKHYQDASSYPQSSIAAAMQSDGIMPSMAVVLPLYYLALALHPSASTYNNLGILLSTLSVQTVVQTPQGLRTMNGQALAMEYYKVGLEQDPKHPHLYTNLGSLLKDMGHLPMAVQMYERAVQFNPTFDVALTNLANAIKDMGHVEDSVKWYKQAVHQNPQFPEAICGLVNAISGICDWSNRGALPGQGDLRGVGPDNQLMRLDNPQQRQILMNGWLPQVSKLVAKQLDDGLTLGKGSIASSGGADRWLLAVSRALSPTSAQLQGITVAPFWRAAFDALSPGSPHRYVNEGGFLIRVVEHLMRVIQRKWYIDFYGKQTTSAQALGRPPLSAAVNYSRPSLPSNLPTPPVPTVLPFHTFTYPLSARQIRLISHRNALRVSQTTLTQPWLPPHVYPPPAPPSPKLKIGYVSSDFNNHPLAHLMQSVFGMHDLSRFDIFCYATTASDQSEYRIKIEREAQHFLDVSQWTTQQVIEQVQYDGIHILVNMNGYTKGARNEIFAARPCPIQIHQLMGFAGTLASGWCDWVIADTTIIPPDTVACEVWRERQKQHQQSPPTSLPGLLDPEEEDDSWMYTEKMAYLPKTYFVTDHKQGFRDDPGLASGGQANLEALWQSEVSRRWQMRKELFPNLPDNFVIFCCLNQLYKIDPLVMRSWLNILIAVPNSVIWLLRFPAAGEAYIKRTAEQWAGPEVASRIVFTDIAPKNVHIARGRIADLFLDSIEVGGHTTSADVLWSGTPIITYPKYKEKLCSRVAASIADATDLGQVMVVHNMEEYEQRAIRLARSLRYDAYGRSGGELQDLRRRLNASRESMPLFDTLKWTRDVETAYEEMWRRWVDGSEFETSPEYQNDASLQQQSGCIWIQ